MSEETAAAEEAVDEAVSADAPVELRYGAVVDPDAAHPEKECLHPLFDPRRVGRDPLLQQGPQEIFMDTTWGVSIPVCYIISIAIANIYIDIWGRLPQVGKILPISRYPTQRQTTPKLFVIGWRLA